MTTTANRTAADVDPATGETRDATHGHFSDQFHSRAKKALRDVGPLTEHIVSLLAHKGRPEEGTVRSKRVDAPMPLNEGAFNDCNELYSRLVYWSVTWAARLGRQAPGPAVRAWRTRRGTVVGLPVDTTPADARYIVSVTAKWLELHLDEILWQEPTDDVLYFGTELNEIHQAAARWPRKLQARYADLACGGGCGGRIALYPVDDAGGEASIVCEKCNREYTQSDYDTEVEDVNRKHAEAVKANKVQQRLAQKYAS